MRRSFRASLLWVAVACGLSFNCAGSSTDVGTGSHAGSSGSAAGDASAGGANQAGSGNHAGSANRAGASHGGSNAEASAGAGDASAGATQDASEAGAAGDGGAAGAAEEPRFEPRALWPMPNAASSGLPNPASYDTTSPGVVLDQVTGLVWQASVPPSTRTWASAKAYCSSLVLGGFQDWRLPSRIELISIVDYTIAKPGPVVDAAAFPNTPNTLFWTASAEALYGTSRAWYVEFDNGFAFTDSSNAEYNARCVRAGLVASTGLEWQHTDTGNTYSFAAAHQH